MPNKLSLLQLQDEINLLKKLLANLQAAIAAGTTSGGTGTGSGGTTSGGSAIVFSAPYQLLGSDNNSSTIQGKLINNNYINDQAISISKIIGLQTALNKLTFSPVTVNNPNTTITNNNDYYDNPQPKIITTIEDVVSGLNTLYQLYQFGTSAYKYLTGISSVIGTNARSYTQLIDDITGVEDIVNDSSTGLSATRATTLQTETQLETLQTEVAENTAQIETLVGEVGQLEVFETETSVHLTTIDSEIAQLLVRTSADEALITTAQSTATSAQASATAAQLTATAAGGGVAALEAEVGGIQFEVTALAAAVALVSLFGGGSSSSSSGGNTTNNNYTVADLSGLIADDNASKSFLSAMVSANYATLNANNTYTLTSTFLNLATGSGSNTKINQIYQFLVDAGFITSSSSTTTTNGTTTTTTTYSEAPGFANLLTTVSNNSSSITKFMQWFTDSGFIVATTNMGVTTYAEATKFPNIYTTIQTAVSNITNLTQWFTDSGFIIPTTTMGVTTYAEATKFPNIYTTIQNNLTNITNILKWFTDSGFIVATTNMGVTTYSEAPNFMNIYSTIQNGSGNANGALQVLLDAGFIAGNTTTYTELGGVPNIYTNIIQSKNNNTPITSALSQLGLVTVSSGNATLATFPNVTYSNLIGYLVSMGFLVQTGSGASATYALATSASNIYTNITQLIGNNTIVTNALQSLGLLTVSGGTASATTYTVPSYTNLIQYLVNANILTSSLVLNSNFAGANVPALPTTLKILGIYTSTDNISYSVTPGLYNIVNQLTNVTNACVAAGIVTVGSYITPTAAQNLITETNTIGNSLVTAGILTSTGTAPITFSQASGLSNIVSQTASNTSTIASHTTSINNNVYAYGFNYGLPGPIPPFTFNLVCHLNSNTGTWLTSNGITASSQVTRWTPTIKKNSIGSFVYAQTSNPKPPVLTNDTTNSYVKNATGAYEILTTTGGLLSTNLDLSSTAGPYDMFTMHVLIRPYFNVPTSGGAAYTVLNLDANYGLGLYFSTNGMYSATGPQYQSFLYLTKGNTVTGSVNNLITLNSNNYYLFSITLGRNTTATNFYSWTNNSSTTATPTSVGTQALNTGTQVNFYVNGQPCGSSCYNGTNATVLGLGCKTSTTNNNTSFTFDGTITQFNLYDYCQSQAEVVQYKNYILSAYPALTLPNVY